MEKDKRYSYCKITITEEKEIIISYQEGNSEDILMVMEIYENDAPT